MNRFRLTLLLLTLWSAGVMHAAAVRMTIGGVQYTTTGDNTVCASLTVKAVGDVTIQETLNIKERTYRTTRIAEAYFKRNAYLTSVSIPNTVTVIDKYAFRGCNNLTRIIAPDTPCDVDAQAFEGCTAIASITTHSNNDVAYLAKAIDASCPYLTQPQPTTVNLASAQPATPAKPVRQADVDINIPQSSKEATNTFALVIGNETYKRVAGVPFASHDAEVFAQYCKQTLGLPAENIDTYINATQGDIRHGVSKLRNRLTAFNGEAKAIVYYAGHGIPDEAEKTAYLLPVDGFATDVQSAYSLQELYDALESVPAQQKLLFLDACFSGAKRDGQMLAEARGVAIRVKSAPPPGNLLVFSAATGEETAFCDEAHQHGMFTYYLLKHLQTTKGDTSLGALTKEVTDNVRRRSVVINDGKMQTPTVNPSSGIASTWETLKLR